MNDQELAALRTTQSKQGADMMNRARQDPRGAPRSSGYNTSGAPAARPAASEPYPSSGPSDAATMGGALDDPNANTRMEVGPDMVPRRVPKEPSGPTSDNGAFGDMMTPKGHALVNAVRASRLARMKPEEVQTPTFGEVAAQTRDAQAQQAEQAAAAPQGPDPEQVAAIQSQLKFVVDTKTGHFTPVLPGEGDPGLSRHDIMVSMDGGQPNIVGQGKGVTPASLSRLMDPKRHPLQPQLNPSFKLPPQYAQLGSALGIPTEGEPA